MSPSIERCTACDEPTGHAGRGDGSLFTDEGIGPLCNSCLRGAQCAENILLPKIAALSAKLARVEDREGIGKIIQEWDWSEGDYLNAADAVIAYVKGAALKEAE